MTIKGVNNIHISVTIKAAQDLEMKITSISTQPNLLLTYSSLDSFINWVAMLEAKM
jgi:hypothetical protein